jgi:hypothetical protein
MASGSSLLGPAAPATSDTDSNVGAVAVMHGRQRATPTDDFTKALTQWIPARLIIRFMGGGLVGS